MRACLNFAGLLFLVMPGLACAGVAGLQGNPAHQQFEPDIKVYPQNFDIARDSQGLIYIASYSGVLIHDGERWDLVEVPGAGAVRVIEPGPDGRMYVGGIGALGYIEHDDYGLPVFHDLTPKALALLEEGDSVADTWKIKRMPETVYFDAGQYLFAYSPGDGVLRKWESERGFGGMVYHLDQLWIHLQEQGLHVLNAGGDLAPIGDGQALTESVVWSLTPLDDETLLVQIADGRWKQVQGTRVSERSMPEGFPPASAILDIVRLEDGSLALAGRDGNIYIYWPDQNRYRSFRLTASPVVGLFHAPGEGLLAATDLAGFRITWPAAWTVIGEESSLIGQVLQIASWGDDLIVLADTGVHRLKESSAGERTRFVVQDWTQLETWDWVSLSDDRALLADSFGVLEVEEDQARVITEARLNPLVLKVAEDHPERVYVGTGDGLGVLEHTDDDWELLLLDEDPSIRVIDILETGPGQLWLATLGSGLWQVELADDARSIDRWRQFGPDEGLQWMSKAQVAFGRLGLDDEGKDRWVVATDNGFFHWADDRFRPFKDDAVPDTALIGGDPLQIKYAPDGSLWAWNYHQVLRRPAGEGSGWIVEDIGPLRRGGISSAWFGPDGSALFGSSSMIMIFDAAVAESGADFETPSASIMLRRVSRVIPGEDPEHMLLDPDVNHRFDQGEFGIRFEFAVPDLVSPDQVAYQERLVGLEADFVPWTSTARVTYFHLDPGSYRFEVRGRDSLGRVSEIEPFEFEILPPWYRTPWAMTGWALLVLAGVVLLIWGIVRWRVARLAADKQRLKQEVEKRTSELSEANQRLEAMAHVDGLTGLANRHRMDDYLELMGPYCRREGVPLAVLLIDVDNFKDYNDRNGHLEGDRYLQRLAGIMQGLTRRQTDLVARYGGEEFLIVLPNTDEDSARDLAEKLRRQVDESDLETTISVGVASRIPDHADGIQTILTLADQALYKAKGAGKNRVAVNSS